MIEIQKITEAVKYTDGLKAVVFDLDDTLYSEKEYVRSGYQAVAKLLPDIQNAEEKMWQAFEKKKSAIDEVLISEGCFTEELKQQCVTAYRFQEPDIHFFDGVEEMLVTLRENGYLLGIITDGRPEGQWAKIDALGLKEFVDYVIVTDELGGIEYRKPNKTAFIQMKEQFGTEFSEMCYVGDNIKKDFIAPEKLGIRPIWFRNSDGLYSCDR